MDPQAGPRPHAEVPPSASTVLYMIYNVDGDGASSYPIENGSTANFWFGHEFDLGGKHYYVALAYDTPEKYGPVDTAAVPAPNAPVNLTQATFVRAAPGITPSWTFWGAQLTIGEFGSYEKADQVDTARKPLTHAVSPDTLLMAVPTKRFTNGIASTGYAVFSFHAVKSDMKIVKPWLYRGTIPTGEDNSAACDNGAVMPCSTSTGTIVFGKDSYGGLPEIIVTTVVANAKHSPVRFVIDADSNQYVGR